MFGIERRVRLDRALFQSFVLARLLWLHRDTGFIPTLCLSLFCLSSPPVICHISHQSLLNLAYNWTGDREDWHQCRMGETEGEFDGAGAQPCQFKPLAKYSFWLTAATLALTFVSPLPLPFTGQQSSSCAIVFLFVQRGIANKVLKHLLRPHFHRAKYFQTLFVFSSSFVRTGTDT